MKYYFSCANGSGDSTDDSYSFEIDSVNEQDNKILFELNKFFDDVTKENFEPSFSEFRHIYSLILDLPNRVDEDLYNFDQSPYDYYNNEGGLIIARHNLENNQIDYINFSHYEESIADLLDVDDNEFIKNINDLQILFHKVKLSKLIMNYNGFPEARICRVIGETEYNNTKLDVEIVIQPDSKEDITVQFNNMSLGDSSSTDLVLMHFTDARNINEINEKTRKIIKNLSDKFDDYKDSIIPDKYPNIEEMYVSLKHYSIHDKTLHYWFSYYDTEYTGNCTKQFINKKPEDN